MESWCQNLSWMLRSKPLYRHFSYNEWKNALDCLVSAIILSPIPKKDVLSRAFAFVNHFKSICSSENADAVHTLCTTMKERWRARPQCYSDSTWSKIYFIREWFVDDPFGFIPSVHQTLISNYCPHLLTFQPRTLTIISIWVGCFSLRKKILLLLSLCSKKMFKTDDNI